MVRRGKVGGCRICKRPRLAHLLEDDTVHSAPEVAVEQLEPRVLGHVELLSPVGILHVVELVGVIGSDEDLAAGDQPVAGDLPDKRFRSLGHLVVLLHQVLCRRLVGRTVIEKVMLLGEQVPHCAEKLFGGKGKDLLVGEGRPADLFGAVEHVPAESREA